MVALVAEVFTHHHFRHVELAVVDIDTLAARLWIGRQDIDPPESQIVPNPTVDVDYTGEAASGRSGIDSFRRVVADWLAPVT